MAIGASYFGNRILRHAAADMADLAGRGFTGVLHTFSENDLAHYREQMGRIVAASHDAGLEVQLGPWGVGGVFGGEAESWWVARHPGECQVFDHGRSVGAGCLSSTRFRRFVRRWADAAIAAGADRLFWDEPAWVRPERFGMAASRWACACQRCAAEFARRYGQTMPVELTDEVAAFREAVLGEFLAEVVGHAADRGAASTVCLLPHAEGASAVRDWEAIAALPGVDTLASTPYWKVFGEPVEPFVGGVAERLRRVADACGVTAQLWLQGFGLGPEDADELVAAVGTARDAGVDDLWVWGYEAGGHMSSLGTREPEQVWEAACAALIG